MKVSRRIVFGFLAGLVSHLIFQGGFGSILYAAEILPALPWSFAPVPPLGVPRMVSLGFWAGLWGVAYALLEPRISARFGWWLGGLVFGAAPLAGHWFVALPLKGLDVGGGFRPETVPIDVGFHAVFGVGLAILLRISLHFARRTDISTRKRRR